MACSALLGASLGALSNGMALLAREEETVIAPSNFVLLPLTFLSSAFMQRDLIPGWSSRWPGTTRAFRSYQRSI